MKTKTFFRSISLLAATTLTAIQLQAQNLNVQVTTINPSCYGFSNGEVVIDITGGSEPYMVNGILINTTTFIAGNLTSGNYTFNIEDATGLATSADVTLLSPQPFNMQAIVTNATTIGGTDGKVELTVPAVPLTFTWTTPNGTGINQGQEDQLTLTAGIYNVLITEANGCETFKRFDVGQPVGNAMNYFTPGFTPITQGSTTNNTSAMMVYPNPSQGHITIKAEVETKEAYVMNDMGVVVHRCQGTTQGAIEELDLNPGSYTLITTDAAGTTHTERIIIR